MARICKLLLACILLSPGGTAFGWGRSGHSAIGALALDHLSYEARYQLYQLLGTSDTVEITDWCNWPDLYRATDAGAWTAPLHFANIPRGAGAYDKTRDCAHDQCVTEAIGRFAAELGDTGLPERQRQEAFGFVCHFVGDLSQPLHAGFALDRGGNDFLITFNGMQQSLHAFWDFNLINFHHELWQPLRKSLLKQFGIVPPKDWETGALVEWTNDSHHLAVTKVYPGDPELTQQFSDDSWQLMRRRLVTGGRNLAAVLDSVLR